MRLRLSLVLLCINVAMLSAAKGPRNLHVTFNSDPEGAMLYEYDPVIDAGSEKLFGYTPLRLKYKPGKPFRDGKACEALRGVMVRWASGAEASMNSLQACPQNGGEQQFIFKRPDGVLGRDLDVLFALEQQRLSLLSAQAQAAAYVALWQSVMNAYPSKQRLRCTSNAVGSYVYTNCY